MAKNHMPSAARKPVRLLVTCEHATRHVPVRWRARLAIPAEILESHRGWDPGAVGLARLIARRHDAELIEGGVSRLIVELNRSPRHPRLWSEFSRGLSGAEKEALLERYYRPYRERVRRLVAEAIARGERVFHLSVHTFTPVLDGEVRRGELGILFDPRREWESALARDWQIGLRGACPDCRVRRNFPYRGVADGLTSALRRVFADTDYAGIELEVNQKLPLAGGRQWMQLRKAITDSLAELTDTPRALLSR